MIEFLAAAFILSLICIFLIIVCDKFGIWKLFKSGYIHKLVNCDFCLTFWLSMIICVVLVLFGNDITTIILPFLSAPLVYIFFN